ncbi:MAG TPA: FtsX-like permease family protein [Thermodesulfobacteriota bacterium]|nr:FtsX-like permease family protein [Thermodesulfobacteriota bacterium]
MRVTLALAWRNLWRQPRRTWLTASAVAFAAALLVFLITLQLGAYDLLVETSTRVFTGALAVQRPGYHERPQLHATIPAASRLAETLRERTGLAAVAVRAYGFALVSSDARSYGVRVAGVEPEREPAVSTLPRLVVRGRYLSGRRAPEILVGERLARTLRAEVGRELTLLGSGKDGAVAATVLPVVGVFASGHPELDRGLVLVPLGTFQELFGLADEGHAVVIAPPDLARLDAVTRAVAAALPADPPLAVLDWETLVPGLKELIQADLVQTWFLYLSLVVLVTFSVLNTMLMAVLERTREFGVMLALGATPARIAGLVMLESLLLALVGLAIGLAAGGGVALYFRVHGFTFPGLREIHAQFGLPGIVRPKLSAGALALGPTVILVFTQLAALVPAARIRRLAAAAALAAA